jgi:hypothetical protein
VVMRTPSTRNLAATLAVVFATGAATLGAAGAGGATTAHTTAVIVPSATTTGTQSLGLSFSISATGLSGSSATTVTGQGQVDFVHQQAAFDVQLPGGILGQKGGMLEVVVAGRTVYLGGPVVSSLTKGGWLRYTPATSAKSPAMTGPSTTFGDAQQALDTLRAHGATVTSAGTATVDGVSATGYSVHVPARAHATATNLTVWADPSDRIIRVALAPGASKTGPSGKVTVTAASVDLTYNPAVSITVPPASATTPLPADLVQALLAQLRSALHAAIPLS